MGPIEKGPFSFVKEVAIIKRVTMEGTCCFQVG